MAECTPRHVVRRDVGQVSLCECGRVALTVGQVTVRVTREEFEQFAELVRESSAHFKAASPPTASAAKHSMH